MKALKGIDLDNSTVLILGGLAVAGFLLWQIGGKAGEVINKSADLVGGVLTGDNAVTQGARTDAYQGAGILGTLGAATDRMAGGSLSTFGEWLGGKVYDATH